MNTRSAILLIFVAALCSWADVAAQGPRVLAVVTENAPVTILPERGRTPLATLSEGTQVQILGAEEDGWYRISFQDNYLLGDRVGYVRAEHLRVSGSLSATPANSKPASSANGSSSAPESTTTSPATPTRRRGGLTESSIAEAIVTGMQRKGGSGLRLLENGQRWAGSPTGPSIDSRFRLQIHTPLAWIQQLASDAAKESRSFNLNDITEEMTEPVLHVTAYSEPRSSGRSGRPSWVRHVVLRGDAKDPVVQPLRKTAFSEHVMSATGGSAVFEGLRLTFSLDDVRRLRGLHGDSEFVISVIGSNGEVKNLKITKELLRDLPM